MSLKLRKARFVGPGENRGFAWVVLALSLFIFAYSTQFGQIPILILYALWFPLLALKPSIVLLRTARLTPFLLMPAFAALSAFWSVAPSLTLRTAIQYATTILIAAIAARTIDPRDLVVGALLGTVLVLGYSFLYGSGSYDVFDATYAFSGAFGSKNQFGLFAAIGLLAALAALTLYRSSAPLSAFAVGVGAAALYSLLISRSATSIASLAAAVAVASAAWVLLRLPAIGRRVGIALGVAAVAAIAVVAARAGLFEGVLTVFGKDETLTGRTYLWREGLRFGADNPAVGMGYNAFWVRGTAEAERLWEEFYITSRSGFNFHNTYVEAYVTMGLVGFALTALLVLWALHLALSVLVRKVDSAGAVFCSAVILLFVVRSFVENDFLGPYSIGTFLVFYAAIRMADMNSKMPSPDVSVPAHPPTGAASVPATSRRA